MSERMAPLTAAAPSETVSSLSRGAALQEELRALQEEAARRGVLVHPPDMFPVESPYTQHRDTVIPDLQSSHRNSIGQLSNVQVGMSHTIERDLQKLQQYPSHGPGMEQGLERYQFATGARLAESNRRDVTPSSYSVPQHAINVLINPDGAGVFPLIDNKLPAKVSLPRINPPLHEREGTTPEPAGLAPSRAATVLYMKYDVDVLSDYQCLVRKNIEFFETGEKDVDSTAKGRNKPILLWQVGIRCRHCSWRDPRERKKGAMSYPAKLNGIYKAAQSLASSHLCTHCDSIPDDIRKQLLALKERKSSAGGGKDYWSDSASILGIAEDPKLGLFYKGTKG